MTTERDELAEKIRAIRGDMTANYIEHGEHPIDFAIADFIRERESLYKATCAEAYQLMGSLGAPVNVLDHLGMAGNGEPMQGSMLDDTELFDIEQRESALVKQVAKLEAMVRELRAAKQ